MEKMTITYVPEYSCTRCGSQCGRDKLTVKKVLFTDMGRGARTLRARTADWLCPTCVSKDADYNREAFKSPSLIRHPKGEESTPYAPGCGPNG